MKYMGSKNRIAKYILPIMLNSRKQNQYWVEPFVGGGNTIDKVDGLRMGSDANKYAIEALISIRDSLLQLPLNNLEFTEDDYNNLRCGDYKHKGYAGFSFSYGGKWLGGWRRDKEDKRDYVNESFRNAAFQSPKLKEVVLLACNYLDLLIPENSIIYCDPPYKNTTKYNSYFNHDIFFEWCREKSSQGHTVFVSEYEAPEDFNIIWEGKVCSSLTKNTGNKHGTEKLFTIDKKTSPK